MARRAPTYQYMVITEEEKYRACLAARHIVQHYEYQDMFGDGPGLVVTVYCGTCDVRIARVTIEIPNYTIFEFYEWGHG
jgi:hypothetical protein